MKKMYYSPEFEYLKVIFIKDALERSGEIGGEDGGGEIGGGGSDIPEIPDF